jgi:hypothetical protein
MLPIKCPSGSLIAGSRFATLVLPRLNTIIAQNNAVSYKDTHLVVYANMMLISLMSDNAHVLRMTSIQGALDDRA